MFRFLFTIVFFGKGEKQHSQNLSHFENESTFPKKKPILKMKAHSEIHLENEKMFKEK